MQLCPWYRKILDYQELCRTEQDCFDALAELIRNVADNFFFQTMDETALAMWEDVFHIVPDPAESPESRRTRVLLRLSMRTPFTLGFLYQRLDELIGPGRWKVTVDYPHYALYIESSAGNQTYASEVAFTVGKIKPAHIVYVNKPVIASGLLLGEAVERMDGFTWNYRLGLWPLGEQPFALEGPKEMIKMPRIPSIRPLLLGHTANFVARDVAAVRLNGRRTVTALTRDAGNETASIVYQAPPDFGEPVTKVELLDAQGGVLAESAVYVPLAAETWIKHSFAVKEGVEDNGGE